MVKGEIAGPFVRVRRRASFLIAGAALAWAGGGAAQVVKDGAQWPPPGVSLYGNTRAPDISGIWLGSSTGIPGEGVQSNSGESADGRPPSYWTPWPLPFTPKYQKIYEQRTAALKNGRAIGDLGARCFPFGPSFTGGAYPNEIIQTPGQVTFGIWQGTPTIIWTDGRPHPKDLKPTYKGHSIGYWVGDTLTIDTVGILPGRFAVRGAHSDKLHYRTTVRMVSKDVLNVVTTAYDEEALTEPVSFISIAHRVTDPKWQMLDDSSCFENNKETLDQAGAPGFPKF